MRFPRSSGLLLHITSLPGRYGTGDLGSQAFGFADFLKEAGQTVWQVLPLVPVGHGNSPYSSPSTFAGNPLFVSPDGLVEDGLLEEADLASTPEFPPDTIDHEQVTAFKMALLATAYERFQNGAAPDLGADFDRFCRENADWLEDYALFMVLKDHFGGGSWTEWPSELVRRETQALEQATREHEQAIGVRRFAQFLFARQWDRLKSYCNERGIRIFGDVPIYVAHDSADVWGNQDLFYLDDAGNPTVVAGVPPDYFSETGQRWGNPIYRWDTMRENDYEWWARRISSTLRQVDILRLDHFRGFEAFWQIEASEPTAVNGEWVKGPGADFFKSVRKSLGELPLVAEDLGLITPEVRSLMREFEFPGMVVLHFAFADDPTCSYLPHMFKHHAVAYTGTHDNDTTAGWWEDLQKRAESDEAAALEMNYVRRYFELENGRDVHWAAIRAVMGSVADIAVVPVQDVLGLGTDARMNMPGKSENNWGWRLQEGALTDELAARLLELAYIYGRAPAAVTAESLQQVTV